MAKEDFHIAKRNDGRLYRAVVDGDRNTVSEELRKEDIDPDLLILDRSLLHHAGARGHKDIARMLIARGADPNRRYGKQQRTLLHFAVATFNFGFGSVLLESGALPSPKTTSNATPLHFAARTGQDYLAQKLVEHGADILAIDNSGRTPFHLALAKGHHELARRLISRLNPDDSLRFKQELKVAEQSAIELACE